jgi:hypothetical protein
LIVAFGPLLQAKDICGKLAARRTIMNIRILPVALALLALFGCAGPTPYERAESFNEGNSDQRLAENRYRVTFKGDSSTQRETVENYLLLRAAEVTLGAGYSWFVFDERTTESKTTYHTTFIGFPAWAPGWDNYGYYWHSWQYDPWDRHWPGSQMSVPSTRYEVYTEIVLLPPDSAKKDEHAINAKDVIARFRPAAAPPPAR